MTLGDNGIPSRGRTGSAPIVCADSGLLAAATIIIAVVIVQPLDVDSPSLVADLTARRDSLLVSSLVDSLGAVALLVFFAGLAARLWQRDAVMLSFALASSGAVAVAVILGQAAIRVVVAGRLVLDSPEIARGLFVLQGVALHFDRFPLAVVIGASAAVFGNWLFRALCALSVVLLILPTVAQVGALTPKGPVVTTTFALLLLWILFTIVLLLREVLTARRGSQSYTST
jgi:hypothetical protein